MFHRSLPGYRSDEIEQIQWRALMIVFPELSWQKALLAATRENVSSHLFQKIASNKDHKPALPPLITPKN